MNNNNITLKHTRANAAAQTKGNANILKFKNTNAQQLTRMAALGNPVVVRLVRVETVRVFGVVGILRQLVVLLCNWLLLRFIDCSL